MSTNIRLMQDHSSWFWHSGESVCQIGQLVIEVVSVSLVLCVSSIPKGAHKTASPTHGSNWDARTKRPTHTSNDDARTTVGETARETWYSFASAIMIYPHAKLPTHM